LVGSKSKTQGKRKKANRKKLFILVVIVLIALIILAIYLLSLREGEDEGKGEANSAGPIELYVSRVIDGDTFEMSDNTTIRLLCVDAPEKGKKGYKEAREFLSEMVLDREVRLERDITDADSYGRLLRYVYVNISGVELFVNKQLVQEGYAAVFRYGDDTARCDEIEGK
jgi:endonuclease YncB( thermonuclease family)